MYGWGMDGDGTKWRSDGLGGPGEERMMAEGKNTSGSCEAAGATIYAPDGKTAIGQAYAEYFRELYPEDTVPADAFLPSDGQREDGVAIAWANAKLWAGASDLADMLEAAVARVGLANAEGDLILTAWVKEARAALKKAGRR